MNHDELNKLTAEADRLYGERNGLENVVQSIRQLHDALNPDPIYELAWRLGRAHFFVGQESSDPRVGTRAHQDGARASRQATWQRREGVEGQFWLGVNLALLAALSSPPMAAANALRARRALQRACAADAGYHGAGPWRVLGRLQHRLPRWLGGGADRARQSYQAAIRLAPQNSVTRIFFAELLIEIGEFSPATQQLEAVLELPDDPEWSFEIERDRRRAAALLDTIKARS